MNVVISALLSLSPALALTTIAASSPSHIYYDSNIKMNSKASGWSLYGCKTEEIEIFGLDPVTKMSRKLSVTLYQSFIEGSKKAVILVPPTGGVNTLDRGYANKLCSAGISVAVLEGWEYQLETSLDLSMHDNGALRYVSAIRHTVEFLESRKINSIGLLGTSIGAIGGALGFGVENRISAATFIVGSARFADVVALSDESGAALLRERRMKFYDLNSIDQYRNLLRNKITLEPSSFLKLTTDRPSLVVAASQDTTVPSDYQYELASLLNSQVISLEGNHIEVIKKMFWCDSQTIVDFFKNNLKGN